MNAHNITQIERSTGCSLALMNPKFIIKQLLRKAFISKETRNWSLYNEQCHHIRAMLPYRHKPAMYIAR